MKPIILNFLSVIRRFKVAVVLNVLGLSVAFAAFMIIMMQLDYDNGFDRFHKDGNQIFRLEYAQKSHTQAVISRPLAERFFESSPHILAGTITYPGPGNIFFHVEDDERNYYEEKSMGVSPEFTDVFTFDFVQGDANALKMPGHVIIPTSLARKIFGDKQAVGKQLIAKEGNMTVGAVYRDFPSNSIVINSIYATIPADENKLVWGNWNYCVYFRVNDPANVQTLFENFKRNFDAQAVFGEDFDWDKSGNTFRFTALQDVHYVADATFDFTPKASKPTLMILFAIAIVIVAIAGINFTNFSTALTPMRVKNINTQRVLGARQRTLRLSLVAEAVIVSLLSYFAAILLIVSFRRTSLAQLVDADLSIAAHPWIVGGTALIAFLTGLFAGLYPAFYMTSFAPALVLKGNFALSPKGRKLRNTLISIQFMASFALIIGATFMYLQNYFMQHSSTGYNKDALITVNIGRIQGNRDVLTNQLKSFAGIEDVTYGYHLLSSSDSYMTWGINYKGERIDFENLPVDYTYLKVMGIELTEGRDFRQEDAITQTGAFVFNETARQKYNLEVNTRMDGFADFEGMEIIGFMPDVKFASFRTTVSPMAFYVAGTLMGMPASNAYIRLKAGTDIRAAMSHIRTTLAGFDAEYPFNVRFFDEVLQRLYEKETALSSLISLFSMIAIFISIVGVFGLVVFDSECRRKEIGIRKVLGASVIGIILMFNKAYFKILAICFVVAAPIAWYAVHRWLENFAYKTPMYWWVYLVAFVAIGSITACTVTFQSWHVASDDPVKAIKAE
jgi:putative ABC transport system permease protein